MSDHIPLSTLHRKSPLLSKLDRLTTFDISKIFEPRLGPRLPRQVLVNLPLPIEAWQTDKNGQVLIGKPKHSWLYASNQIRTAKYSLLTFLPRNLLEQFRRIANIFFLILLILQFIPKFSQVSPILAALPLLAVLAITALKDAYEDVRRHQADHKTNSQTVHVLHSQHSVSSNTKPHYLNPNLTRPKNSGFKLNWFSSRSGQQEASILAAEAGQIPNPDHSHGPATHFGKKHWWNRRVKVSAAKFKTHTPPDSLPPSLHSHLDPNSETSLSPDAVDRNSDVRFRKTAWADLRVGDFVKLRNDESVPADMIICSTSDEEENVCFIETKNLDGETNLKSRHAVKELSHLRSGLDCANSKTRKNRFIVESEAPDPNLFRYAAAVVFPDIKLNPNGHPDPSQPDTSKALEKPDYPDHQVKRVAVDLNTILLRGTVVRNTEWVIGLVIFTGPDTKIMLNSSGTPSKRSKVERLMNPMVFLNLGLLAVMCLFNGIGTHLSDKYYYARNSYWTVGEDRSDDNPGINGAVGFANAMITYQNIVPISLYICIEFVRTLQAFFIWADDHMYYRPTKKRTLARSWNLSDDLGQIQYIFSDKTGTLTQNLMLFRQCCIGGKVYAGMGRLEAIAEEEEDSEGTVNGGDVMMASPLSENITKLPAERALPSPSSPHKPPLSKPNSRPNPRSSSPSSSASTPRPAEKDSEESVANSADPKYQDTPTYEPFQDHELSNDMSDPQSNQARLIHGFFATLGLCHTVLASEDEHGVIQYKAQSPDESALVQAAADVGFVFRGRDKNVMRLEVPSDAAKIRGRQRARPPTQGAEDLGIELLDDVEESEDAVITEYELLEVNEFSSARKRMSVIVRRLDSSEKSKACDDGLSAGQLYLLCKGADNVIFERLGKGQEELKRQTDDQLEEFAASGLRTLCLAYRRLDEAEFQSWSTKYSIACSQVGPDREVGIEAVRDELEHSLQLLGATAIEDKLQDGVPEAIAELKRAGIKVWVATGDKLETAVAIARSCNLIAKDMNLIVIRGGAYDKPASAYKQLRQALVKFFDGEELVDNLKAMPPGHVADRRPSRISTNSEMNQAGRDRLDLEDIVGADNGNRLGGYGLVIDGASLHHAFEEPFTKEVLLELSTRCQAVICCRTSPKQKAEIVTLVKDGTGAMTLAIGDGANDVSMIQAADIGVGVSGEEGLQAVNSSDYAIGQFRYLCRLLFVHGHWSYARNSKMIVNFFYKEIIGISVLWFYQFWCAYSTTTLYEYTYLLFYNVFWTLLPVIGIGVFDQDIRQRVLVNVPELYSVGREGKLFGLKVFSWYMLEGIYQGAVCFFFITFAYNTTSARTDGFDVSINEFSTVIIVAVVIAANTFNGLNQSAWNWWMLAFVLFGSVLVLLYTAVYSAIKPAWIWTTVYGNNHFLWTAPYWWFGLLLTIVLCLIPHYVIKYYREMYRPNDLQILRYIDRHDPDHDYKKDPQMPYLRERERYDDSPTDAPLARQKTSLSVAGGAVRPGMIDRTRTSLSVTHDMATGQLSPFGRGFGFDQADGVGEIAVGNRLRRYNTSLQSIPRLNQSESRQPERTRSIRIGNLEILLPSAVSASPSKRDSRRHSNSIAKRLSGFIANHTHHTSPRSRHDGSPQRDDTTSTSFKEASNEPARLSPEQGVESSAVVEDSIDIVPDDETQVAGQTGQGENPTKEEK